MRLSRKQARGRSFADTSIGFLFQMSAGKNLQECTTEKEKLVSGGCNPLPARKIASSSELAIRSGLDRCSQRFRYFAGDVVLNHQDVVEWPVVGFRPDNVPAVSANQPRIDPHSGA